MSQFLCPPHLQKDFYKVGHVHQYPKDLELVVSNFTPRGTRRPKVPKGICWLGLQPFILDYLIAQWNENFFHQKREKVLKDYKRVVDNCLGPGINIDHIGELHEFGILPLLIKALPEGTQVPYRVPPMTIENTHPNFGWLPNMLETVLSNHVYLPSTSATTAAQYWQNFRDYAIATGGDLGFIQWQGHDFSMRGMEGTWAAASSGSGHLVFFTGTDTIPAILFVEQFYGSKIEKELIGGSVPATEHSVMCMSLKDGEFELFKRLITEVYPKGLVSIVSDTWSLKTVVTDYLVRLKDVILKREGKVVIRPDSGDPVKIVLGDPNSHDAFYRQGLTEALAEIFGTTVNDKGYRVLDPHIGWIYGDSITLERQEQTLEGLKFTKFVSTTPVDGIGSYTYQHVTRDTDGWAMKATYAEAGGKAYNLYKDPETDNGVKKSACGLLKVERDEHGVLVLKEGVSKEEAKEGLLEPVFRDGKLVRFERFKTIRTRAQSYNW